MYRYKSNRKARRVAKTQEQWQLVLDTPGSVGDRRETVLDVYKAGYYDLLTDSEITWAERVLSSSPTTSRRARRVKAAVTDIYVNDQILAGNILGDDEEGDPNASAENLAALVEDAFESYLSETFPGATLHIDIEVQKNVSGASRPLTVEYGDDFDFDADWETTRHLESTLEQISGEVWERWDDWYVKASHTARRVRAHEVSDNFVVDIQRERDKYERSGNEDVAKGLDLAVQIFWKNVK